MPNCMEISKHVLISLDISVVISLGKGFFKLSLLCSYLQPLAPPPTPSSLRGILAGVIQQIFATHNFRVLDIMNFA